MLMVSELLIWGFYDLTGKARNHAKSSSRVSKAPSRYGLSFKL